MGCILDASCQFVDIEAYILDLGASDWIESWIEWIESWIESQFMTGNLGHYQKPTLHVVGHHVVRNATAVNPLSDRWKTTRLVNSQQGYPHKRKGRGGWEVKNKDNRFGRQI